MTIIDLVTSANIGNAAIDALVEAFQQRQDERALDEISQNARRGLAQLVGTRDNVRRIQDRRGAKAKIGHPRGV